MTEAMWDGYTTIATGIEGYGRGREKCEAGIEVRLTEQAAGRTRLSITGVVGTARQLRGGDAETCGQCVDAIAEIPADKLGEGWDAAKLAKLVEIWRRWHLNDMRAGCEHQREGETPAIGETCGECGYGYGTAWLYEPLPDEVEAFARELAAQQRPTKPATEGG